MKIVSHGLHQGEIAWKPLYYGRDTAILYSSAQLSFKSELINAFLL